jgi:hypothetical protein
MPEEVLLMFSQFLKRLAGPALITGGLLWITIHMMMIIIILMTGKLAGEVPASQQSFITPIYFLLLPLSSLFIGVGLLGVFALLEGRSRKLGTAGVVLASIGMVMGIVDLLFLIFSSPTVNGILGVFASVANGLNGLMILGSTVLLGWAALRTHILPRWAAWVLIIIGVITAPILLVTPLPIGPVWATDTIAFFIGGIGYTVVGVVLIVTRKRTVESKTDTPVKVVAQAK